MAFNSVQAQFKKLRPGAFVPAKPVSHYKKRGIAATGDQSFERFATPQEVMVGGLKGLAKKLKK